MRGNPNLIARYWVIGGKHIDMTFQHRCWSEVEGPFNTRHDAEAMWRKLSFLHTHDARVRYTIVRDAEVARAA